LPSFSTGHYHSVWKALWPFCSNGSYYLGSVDTDPQGPLAKDVHSILDYLCKRCEARAEETNLHTTPKTCTLSLPLNRRPGRNSEHRTAKLCFSS